MGGNADRENGRLGVFREPQHWLGPLEAEARERHSERVVGLLERAARDDEALGEVAPHADTLRPLPRKEADGPRRHDG